MNGIDQNLQRLEKTESVFPTGAEGYGAYSEEDERFGEADICVRCSKTTDNVDFARVGESRMCTYRQCCVHCRLYQRSSCSRK